MTVDMTPPTSSARASTVWQLALCALSLVGCGVLAWIGLR